MHCLILEGEKLCIHSYLIIKANIEVEANKDSEVNFEFDRDKTVDNVVKNVTDKFPSAMGDVATFLQKNKAFVDHLCKVDINAELAKYSANECPLCHANVIDWPHKTKESFLVTIGELKSVVISVKKCPECNILLYLDLFEFGIVPLHNKANFGFLNNHL